MEPQIVPKSFEEEKQASSKQTRTKEVVKRRPTKPQRRPQQAPKSSSEQPKRPRRGPKSIPEEPKTPPRGPQEHTKAAQETPKARSEPSSDQKSRIIRIRRMSQLKPLLLKVGRSVMETQIVPKTFGKEKKTTLKKKARRRTAVTIT